MVRAVICGLALLGSLAGASRGDVIFNDFGPSFGHGTSSSYGISGSSTYNASWAMKFTPTQNEKVTSVDLAVQLITGTNSVTFQLRSDSAGSPGAVIESYNFVNESNTTTTSLLSANSGTNPVLTAGTAYWMAGLPGGTDTQMGWYYNNQSVTGSDASSNASLSNGWNVQANKTLAAFDVMGSPAPEPVGMSLLSGGTYLLLARRRRCL